MSRWVWLGLGVAALASARAESLRLVAGEVDRRDSLVELPAAAGGRYPPAYVAVDGRVFPVQLDSAGKGHLILDRLAAGESLKLEAAERPVVGLIAAERQGKTVVFKTGGEVAPVTYQAEAGEFPRGGIDEKYRRGGYVHPLVSPAGKVVSGDFPEGHLHHHGVWFAWTNTRFQGRKPDFWNMGAGTGKVEFEALESFGGGAVFGELMGRHRYLDLTASPPVAALDEKWRMRVLPPAGGVPAVHRLDLTVRQECATEDPLILPEYHYGGLGFRGNQLWNGAGNLIVLTSDGETDRVKANATRARWCYVGGLVDGGPSGVAILGHPGNFRFPEPIRMHPGEPFFCFAPSQLGEWRIEPGKAHVARYRFVVFDGAPDRELIERWWRDYAEPVAVERE